MSGRVIQARYLGGRPGPQLVQMRPVGAPPLAGTVQAMGRPGLAGPPPLAGQALQAKGAPVPPSRALQAHGAAESFAVDPVRLGLGQGRGNPLPDAVRAKMEAAFGTDFSRVRVHEGPQAARIGAIAFTTGHDIYFAPGQYRPETVQGQQLLGHELAHVVQQRQGRVEAPGSGVSVVQDHALEAEADRLGMRAALQCKATFTAHHRAPRTVGILQRANMDKSAANSRPPEFNVEELEELPTANKRAIFGGGKKTGSDGRMWAEAKDEETGEYCLCTDGGKARHDTNQPGSQLFFRGQYTPPVNLPLKSTFSKFKTCVAMPTQFVEQSKKMEESQAPDAQQYLEKQKAVIEKRTAECMKRSNEKQKNTCLKNLPDFSKFAYEKK